MAVGSGRDRRRVRTQNTWNRGNPGTKSEENRDHLLTTREQEDGQIPIKAIRDASLTVLSQEEMLEADECSGW